MIAGMNASQMARATGNAWYRKVFIFCFLKK